ncbi:hypothetical protein RCL1_007086 [Eukaryota sp. TZLM3-RCL]
MSKNIEPPSTQILSDENFAQLEDEFNSVLQDIENDDSLNQFKKEYLKLWRALKRSHEGEKRLADKCRVLHEEILANAAKVSSVLKQNETDANNYRSAVREVEKLKRVIEAYQKKEEQARETILRLKEEIDHLQNVCQKDAGLSASQQQAMKDMMEEKQVLTQERDEKVQMVIELRNQLAKELERVKAIEGERLSMENDLHSLRSELTAKRAEVEAQKRKRANVEMNLKRVSSELERRQKELDDKQSSIDTARQEIAELQASLMDTQTSVEQRAQVLSQLQSKTQKLELQLAEKVSSVAMLERERNDLQDEVKERAREVQDLKNQLQKGEIAARSLERRFADVSRQKSELEDSKTDLRRRLDLESRELESVRKSEAEEKRRVEQLVRQLNSLEKRVRREEGKTEATEELHRSAEAEKLELEREIAAYKKDIEEQRKEIERLQNEQDRYSNVSSDALNKLYKAQERIRVQELTIDDLQRKISETEGKLKQQVTLYEAVRTDRNLYNKQLIETQDEALEMGRKFKIMNQQIKQLKEEITKKDTSLIREHFDRVKLEKERDTLKTEVKKMEGQAEKVAELCEAQENQITKLLKIISDADLDRVRQQKLYEEVLTERDILGSQLIRRNDELALLYEKVRIQQSIMSKGEAQYRQRMDDIKLLKTKIGDLKRELAILVKSSKIVKDLKAQVHKLQKELYSEKAKVTALSQELENPLNVHRWRTLEATNPDVFDLIQKVQTLQRRLIAKTEEVVAKNLLIEEKEKLFDELKKILERSPGVEVAEQNNLLRTDIREKTKQLKVMVAELNQYQVQVQELQYEIDSLRNELKQTQSKYFELKRIQQKKEQSNFQSMDIAVELPEDQRRFVGGGFRV